MGYVIHYDNATDTIITVVEGVIHVPLVTEFALETFTKGDEQHCNKFLVDLRDTQVNESTVNIAEFALHMEKTGIRTEHHVAVVIRNNESEHKLFGAMSKNRGYARLRYFYDLDAATTWLHNLP
jgi:hypothetical protein